MTGKGLGRFEVGWDEGVVVRCGEDTLRLDPQNGRGAYPHSFISHAHNDHTGGMGSKNTQKLATPATLALYQAATGRPTPTSTPLEYNREIKVGDLKVKTHNAGHILGSSQFEIVGGEGTILYTGDLNCIDTLTTTPAEKVRCDLLIIEATFGRVDLTFPPRTHTYRRMVEWTVERVKEGRVPVFYVYTLGKAQEVITILNRFTEIPVLTHPLIAKVNETYAKHGLELRFSTLEGARPGGCAVIMPTGVKARPTIEKEASASATGWALRWSRSGSVFPLSSHADFPQLLSFVEAVKPRKVYTCFGQVTDLARAIERRLGVEAKPLPLLSKRRGEVQGDSKLS